MQEKISHRLDSREALNGVRDSGKGPDAWVGHRPGRVELLEAVNWKGRSWGSQCNACK